MNYIDPIYSFFLASFDFNGIPLNQLCEEWNVEISEGLKILIKLLIKGDCTIQCSNNPHIIYNNIPETSTSIEDVEKILKDENPERLLMRTCVYPSPAYLEQHRSVIGFSPYSKRLALGCPHLQPLFFKFEVLKPYVDNPNYDLQLDDYSGSLAYRVEEDTKVDKKGYYKLETFGLGRDERGTRVIVSFPRYLRQLSLSQQNHWEANELTSSCDVLDSYLNNILKGSWYFPQSISKGVLNERMYINDLWEAIFGERLFKNDYTHEDLIREYSFLFIPTSSALNKFRHFMDKLFSDNMNVKHIRSLLEEYSHYNPLIQETHIRQLGSLAALELLMDSIYTLHDGRMVGKEIVAPFKEIRKERQPVAHKIILEDHYDVAYYNSQIEIFKKVYNALKKLRIILSSHPKAKEVKAPKGFSDKVYIF